jgi:hypothetical protein
MMLDGRRGSGLRELTRDGPFWVFLYFRVQWPLFSLWGQLAYLPPIEGLGSSWRKW